MATWHSECLPVLYHPVFASRNQILNLLPTCRSEGKVISRSFALRLKEKNADSMLNTGDLLLFGRRRKSFSHTVLSEEVGSEVGPQLLQ
ncbi:hypothetical protein CEXT_349591 [Caerostris extrusa]|uniref:Uncharacterized protein n=1 Tax=Caerostris extrusa TaxID=172846 RepID=A0AAV4VA40_CAEEX|nr:hypothetical protein CEXT_349591 [Caerostris extrusa]